MGHMSDDSDSPIPQPGLQLNEDESDSSSATGTNDDSDGSDRSGLSEEDSELNKSDEENIYNGSSGEEDGEL